MKINFKEFLYLSNLISLFRLLLFFPFYYLLENYNTNQIYNTYLLILILIAFISDLSDGYIARKTNQVTELGKIIDPLADKILVGLIIFKLYLLNEIPKFYFLLVILRDLLIFFGGIYISAKVGKVLPSNVLGKATVFSIGIFILLTIVQLNKETLIYHIVLIVSSTLCFISLIGYTLRAGEIIKWDKSESS